ncbi:MAG: phenylalanine--tRNA ligase subunit beta [Saprospiraceae bacterium]|nr:phenylalanine--tRNA ligase subunit beta [Saprospiraceae bacterium]
MKLSLDWVKQYITLEYSPEEIAEMLTTIGLEVEGWEKKEAVKGGLSGVVVGHILECKKHPDADKLSLTKVDTGLEIPLQIVCGAPNVAAGQKVLVATIGTTLYDKEGNPWKIKKGKIRGEESEGMICAQDELGLGEDHSGIMILKNDAVIGQAAATHLNISEDIIFEIGLTPNRSDATSHLGVVKDLYAYLKVNKNFSGDIKFPESVDYVTEKVKFNIDVEVLNKEACPRYSGVTITGVTIGESPDWIKNALLSIDIKPINNVVDITNYVLFELGQPLHAFDADKIESGKIIVDCLPEGTKFITLEGTERTLKEKDLLICDGNKRPMCLAGVYGGLHSGVSSETVNIFLESAYFDPKYIRATSTSHLLRTDAAKIFEKGADPNITIFALKRAAGMIRKYCGGSISNVTVDLYPTPLQGKDISVRYKKVEDVIGIDISKDKIQQILSCLGMTIKTLDDATIMVNPGTNKHDVTREIDIIEEILRIYGLNNIPVHSNIKSTLTYTQQPDKNTVKESICQFLSSNHFHEMMGLSLIESKHFAGIKEMDPSSFVYINNTSNVHLDILRPDLLISGLQSVAYNANRQQNNVKMYEHGKSYIKKNGGFEEKECITVFISGKNQEDTWYSKDKEDASFYDIKHIGLSVLQKTGLHTWQENYETKHFGLEYGMIFHRGDLELITTGKVSPALLKKAGIKQNVYYAQIDLTNILKAIDGLKFSVKEISRFPSMKRDLAIIADSKTTFKEMVDVARRTDKKILKDIRLFDVFTDKNKVGEGKKSYALSFYFENTEKTLSDKDVDTVMEQIITSLEKQLSVFIRK